MQTQTPAEPTETALRLAIAGIENKDVFDRGDQDRLSRLKAELFEIEAVKPSGLFREVIVSRQQRDKSADFLLREIARIRFMREEGRPAEILEPDDFRMHRKLHGIYCRRLREAMTKRRALRISAPSNIVRELLSGRAA